MVLELARGAPSSLPGLGKRERTRAVSASRTERRLSVMPPAPANARTTPASRTRNKRDRTRTLGGSNRGFSRERESVCASRRCVGAAVPLRQKLCETRETWPCEPSTPKAPVRDRSCCSRKKIGGGLPILLRIIRSPEPNCVGSAAAQSEILRSAKRLGCGVPGEKIGAQQRAYVFSFVHSSDNNGTDQGNRSGAVSRGGPSHVFRRARYGDSRVSFSLGPRVCPRRLFGRGTGCRFASSDRTTASRWSSSTRPRR